MADQPEGFLAKYGARVVDNGYLIVPIAKGSKQPTDKGWTSFRSTKALVRKWVQGDHARSGVGILTRTTPAVDLDLRCKDAAAHMYEFVTDMLGEGPKRIGRAPKQLLLFQTDEPFPKKSSKAYLDEWGDKQQVEILADGQQFVAYAIHPDTGKPYMWPGKDGPLHTSREDLPTITEEQAEEIVAEFDRYAEEQGWERVTNGKIDRMRSAGSNVDRNDPFAADRARTEIDDEELEDLLMKVEGYEDYDTWLQIGMALFHQFEGADDGLDMWHRWSEQADNYDADALNDKWATFDISDKRRAPITARIIIKLAKEAIEEETKAVAEDLKHRLRIASDESALKSVCADIKKAELDGFVRAAMVGQVKERFKAITGSSLPVGDARAMIKYERPEVPEAPRWLQDWIYITKTETFWNSRTRWEMSTKAFNDSFARKLLTPVERLEGKTTPDQLPSHVALNLVEIPIVENRMYMPGEDQFFTANGLPYINSYTDAGVPEVPSKLSGVDRDNIAKVERHFELLFEIERDRNLLIDWIAYIVQTLDRVNWAPLIQGAEGDGKSFIFALLSAVLGYENCDTIKGSALTEKYNAWAEGSLMVFVEEVRLTGNDRYAAVNNLKPNITNPVVSIRRMQTDTYKVINRTSYVATTNFKDGMPVGPSDTRWFIMFSRFQHEDDVEAFKKKNPTYYQELFDTVIESPGALRKWLLERELGPEFDSKHRAPPSANKAEMSYLNATDEEETLDDILKNSPRMDMTIQLLNSTAMGDEFAERQCEIPYGKAMKRLLSKAGFTFLGKFRVNGEYGRFWSRKPKLFMRDGVFDADLVRDWVNSDL